MTSEELDSLREQISAIDNDILTLVAKRLETAREIGRTKRKDELGIRDHSREEFVVKSAAAKAARSGIDHKTASTITEVLIDAAVRAQDDDLVRPLEGKKALVVGAGRMGAWTARFLSNRGASMSVFDPRAELKGYPNVESPGEAAKEADMVIIASPLGTAVSDTQQIIDSSPKGVIFDLCSVKAHMRELLLDSVKRGLKATSVHPMFGANVATPAGLNVLVCSCGCSEADETARNLFGGAGARIINVPLDEHDNLIAYALGAPHLCALLFGQITSKSSHPVDVLSAIQGPSFSRLADLASGITNESRRVYHDIQRLNPLSIAVLESMATELEALKEASLSVDAGAFAKIMDEQKSYFRGWSR
ncbi:MAG: prephenate dehydrogenase/arogenate dehydrogenase family protein [Methanobacteriota archaeon]|nr:MAG: prephenate dehydrogenase/arogenate dehydrogenase family protein [Euryarchaeota archaeon]